MALHKEEKKWILEHIENGKEVIKFTEPNDIIDVLSDFTVQELYDNNLESTKDCYDAECIIDRLAYYWDMKDPDEDQDLDVGLYESSNVE